MSKTGSNDKDEEQTEDGNAPSGGQLSKKAIEKADKVLDDLLEVLKQGEGSSTQKAILTASAEYYNLIPHDFGMKKPPPIKDEDMVGAEKALLQFYLRMGFEEV